MTTTVNDTATVGKKLIDLCNAGEHIKAIETLYADNVVSCEAMEMPGHPAVMEGKAAVLGKS